MKMSDKQKAIRAALKGDNTLRRTPRREPEYMIFKSVKGYLQIDRIPKALYDLKVIHSLSDITQDNYESHVCMMQEFLERYKSGDIEGWAMIALEPRKAKYDHIKVDFLTVDARGRGQFFLADQTIGRFRSLFNDCQFSQKAPFNKLPPHIALYLVPDLDECIQTQFTDEETR